MICLDSMMCLDQHTYGGKEVTRGLTLGLTVSTGQFRRWLGLMLLLHFEVLRFISFFITSPRQVMAYIGSNIYTVS